MENPIEKKQRLRFEMLIFLTKQANELRSAGGNQTAPG